MIVWRKAADTAMSVVQHGKAPVVACHMTEDTVIEPQNSFILKSTTALRASSLAFLKSVTPRRVLRSEVDPIGQEQVTLWVYGLLTADRISRSVKAPDHTAARLAKIKLPHEFRATEIPFNNPNLVTESGRSCRTVA